MIRVAGLPDDETLLLNRLVEQVEAKQDRNELRSALMNHKRTFENWPLVQELGDLRAVVGWPAKGVETLGRRCRMEGFTLAGGQGLDEFGLDTILEETQYFRRARMGELNSLVHSVSFEVATTGATDDEPEVLLTHVSALNGTGDWNGRLGRLDSFLSVTDWGDKEKPGPAGWALYMPYGTWVFQNGTLDLQEHSLGRVPVEPLVYKPRLDRPFGQSRITRSAIFLTRSAARVIVRSEATADLYSAPSLLALGLSASDIDSGAWLQGIGNVVGIPDMPVTDVPEAPNLARVDIKTIAQATQEPHVAQLRAWAQLFSGEMSIPVSSLGISTEGNPTSAESYAASREDLIAEAEDANAEWGAAHRRSLLNAYALREGVHFREVPGELLGLRPKFRDPRHMSQAAAADAFVKVASVIPGLADTAVAVDMLGLDPSLAERLKSDLRRTRSSSMLDRLAGELGGDDTL